MGQTSHQVNSSKERFERDIIEIKKGILRAKELIPPLNQSREDTPAVISPLKNKPITIPGISSEEKQALKDVSVMPIEKAPPRQDKENPPVIVTSSEPKPFMSGRKDYSKVIDRHETIQEKPVSFFQTQAPKKYDIPKFNLAEEIMAEQRKIVAITRKAPQARSQIQAMAADDYLAINPPTPILSAPEKQIIAEIVARDIERLCK